MTEKEITKKCKYCDMPADIKAKNTSIKNYTGLCSMCFLLIKENKKKLAKTK